MTKTDFRRVRLHVYWFLCVCVGFEMNQHSVHAVFHF